MRMSDQEKYEAIGKTVTEYGQVKVELALRIAETEVFAEALSVAAQYFREKNNYGPPSVHRGDLPEVVMAVPSTSEMMNLANAILGLRRRKEELVELLKAVGMEPKD